MDKFIKRVQSRLTSKKVQWEGKTVPLWKVRQFYEVFVADRYNPSENELNLVIEKLTGHCAGGPEPETTSIELITSSPEPTVTSEESAAVFQLAQPEEEAEAIAPPKAEEGQEDGFSPLQLQEEATTLSKPETSTNGIVHQEQGHLQEPSIGGITQAEITQAISQAIAQVGQQGNSEAVEILTSLANELSADIADTQEMVTALVTAYLGKRQHLLSSALGALNNLRTAQTESFQSGLDQNFFEGKNRSKQEFLCKVGAMFN